MRERGKAGIRESGTGDSGVPGGAGRNRGARNAGRGSGGVGHVGARQPARADVSAQQAVANVRRAVGSLPPGPWLLAVSGGRDSMALLDACAEWRRADIAAVATFDHGTGPAAARAVAHVEKEAMRLGIPLVSGTAASHRAQQDGAASSGEVGEGGEPEPERSAAGERDSPGEAGDREAGERDASDGAEAAWRVARWAFLTGWAREFGARVATAHTRDDQAETVFMRILRDAGARGLAGMRAASPVLRPFLGLSRAEVAAFAKARGLTWVDDPSNERLDHLRNRVRLELLPAFERARPGFMDWLIALGDRAASVRETIAAVVDELAGRTAASGGVVVIPTATLAGFQPSELEVLWPEIAARAGVTLDRRGLARLVRETAHLRDRKSVV